MAIIPLGNGKGVTWEPTTELICARCRQPFDPATLLRTVYLVHDNVKAWGNYDELKIYGYWYLHAACRDIEKILKDMGANIRWYMHEMPMILGFTIEKDGYRKPLRHANRAKNFCPTVYEKLYEQWRPALAGLDTNVTSTVDISSLDLAGTSSPVTAGMPTPAPAVLYEKQPGYLARRFEVFRRDGYRCQICGRAAVDGPHVRLELEHRIARANGGTDDLANLWTCCYDCNRGKGTKDLIEEPPPPTRFTDAQLVEQGFVPVILPEETQR